MRIKLNFDLANYYRYFDAEFWTTVCLGLIYHKFKIRVFDWGPYELDEPNFSSWLFVLTTLCLMSWSKLTFTVFKDTEEPPNLLTSIFGIAAAVSLTNMLLDDVWLPLNMLLRKIIHNWYSYVRCICTWMLFFFMTNVTHCNRAIYIFLRSTLPNLPEFTEARLRSIMKHDAEGRLLPSTSSMVSPGLTIENAHNVSRVESHEEYGEQHGEEHDEQGEHAEEHRGEHAEEHRGEHVQKQDEENVAGPSSAPMASRIPNVLPVPMPRAVQKTYFYKNLNLLARQVRAGAHRVGEVKRDVKRVLPPKPHHPHHR